MPVGELELDTAGIELQPYRHWNTAEGLDKVLFKIEKRGGRHSAAWENVIEGVERYSTARTPPKVLTVVNDFYR